jgi:hypothetical protein
LNVFALNCFQRIKKVPDRAGLKELLISSMKPREFEDPLSPPPLLLPLLPPPLLLSADTGGPAASAVEAGSVDVSTLVEVVAAAAEAAAAAFDAALAAKRCDIV